MSKDDAIIIMNNSNLIDKKGVIFFLLHLKNEWEILNSAKDFYGNDKERLKEQARSKYRNLSEEKKIKKREYGRNRYRNMSKEKKQRLKEYQKKLP